jgi:hypothetical protein
MNELKENNYNVNIFEKEILHVCGYWKTVSMIADDSDFSSP